MLPQPASSRLRSLDVFRGITVVLMILVNSRGYNQSYSWLSHAAWDGCTLADAVFAFFIFIMGVSCAYSFKPTNHVSWVLGAKIVKRTCILFLIGLALNAFPHVFDVSHLRILGVLQRIAICYCFTAFMLLTTTQRTQTITAISILIIYWLVVTLGSPHDYNINNNISALIDQRVLSKNHLYNPYYDPEGILSTFPALATALLGSITGITLHAAQSAAKKRQQLLFAGFTSLVIGFIWSLNFPINKTLWSSSYVLWTTGWAWLVLACCYSLIEINHHTRWCNVFDLFGRHALLAYVLHIFLLKIQAMITITSLNGPSHNVRQTITALLFGEANPNSASLGYALLYLLLWYGVIAWVDQRQH